MICYTVKYCNDDLLHNKNMIKYLSNIAPNDKELSFLTYDYYVKECVDSIVYMSEFNPFTKKLNRTYFVVMI